MIGHCGGVGDHTVAGAGVIGVDATRHTVLDRVADGRAGKAADRRRGAEGAPEDQGDDSGDLLPVQDEDPQAHEDIQDSHDRHRAGHDFRDSLEAAPDRHKAGDTDDDHRVEIRDTEGLVHGTGHSLGLDAAGPGPEEEAEHSQDDGALFPPERIFQDKGSVADIFVHRLLVVFAVALADDDLAGLGRHTEKGGDPHPHQGAGAAADDRGRDSADIAGAHCVGQGRACGTETGDRPLALAFGADLSVGVFKVKDDLPLIAEGKTDAEDDADPYQQDRHPGTPHKVIDRI